MSISETKKIVEEKSQTLFKVWKSQISNPEFIGLLSPFYSQYEFFKEIFPQSRITVLNINSWNLNEFKNFKFDIIFASAVFMYSNDPKSWFDNVFKSCKYFWIQDLINRSRSKLGILGKDGDKMRYYKSPDIISNFNDAYDLSIYNEKLLSFESFSVGPAIHFLANFKGNLDKTSNPNLNFYSKF